MSTHLRPETTQSTRTKPLPGVPPDPERRAAGRRSPPPNPFRPEPVTRSSACSSGRRSRRRSSSTNDSASRQRSRCSRATTCSSVAYATEEILKVAVPAVGVLAFSLVMPITWGILGCSGPPVLVPPDDQSLPQRGWCLHRDEGQLRVAHRPRSPGSPSSPTTSSRSPSPCLRASRRSRRRPRSCIRTGCPLGRVHRDHRVGQPSRRPRIGADVRGPHVLLHRDDVRALGTGCRRARVAAPAADPAEEVETTGAVGLFLILHAFASGGAAVTGVEAISNGVPAFRKPAGGRTLVSRSCGWAASSVVMFLGLSFLAVQLHASPLPDETVISRTRRGHLGGGGDKRALLRPAGGDDAHPSAGCQHGIRGLPAPRELPRGRRLHAAASSRNEAIAWCSRRGSSGSLSWRPAS